MPTSWPASRTAWSRRPPTTCAWTARRRPRPTSGSRGQVLRARRHAAGRRSRASRRMAYDGTEMPLTAADVDHRPGHHARHRPWRRPALPAQGDQRGARQLPQDAAREDRRDSRRHAARSRPTWASVSLPADIAVTRLADGSITKVEVIGQGTAAVAGRSMAAVLDHAVPAVPWTVDPITATEYSRLRLTAGHERHADRRRQPERHHHRHQPHRRPRPWPRRRRARPS